MGKMKTVKFNGKEYEKFREPHGGYVLMDINNQYVEEITFSSKDIISFHVIFDRKSLSREGVILTYGYIYKLVL